MSPEHAPAEQTLLEALTARLRGCGGAPDGVATPAAILWPDPNGDWRPLTDALRTRLPEFLILGDYAPEQRAGPAIWIRCVVDRTIDVADLGADRIPIVYLPGVSRQQLRAGEECPRSLQPLVELMYRGTLWLQKNGYEWTLTAFLTSPKGLGLEIARDQATLDALARALPELAETPLADLAGRHLESEDFDRLLTPDLYRDLLRWMNEPEGYRQRMSEESWEAFRSQCRERLDFDPEAEGETEAGKRLGMAEGAWAEAWARFDEAARSYPGIPDLLKRSKPAELFVESSRWPDENDKAERALRDALAELPRLPHREACDRVAELEEQHGERRSWVWARLGEAPLAKVLRPLASLADGVRTALGGGTPDEIAASYTDEKWRADAAALRALALAPSEEEGLIHDAVRALWQPWLEDSARAFQDVVQQHPLPTATEADGIDVAAGECLLFVDGLRYDLAQELATQLEDRGCRIRMGHRWSGLPSVTATAKPAVTPIADRITGTALPEDFAPVFAADERTVDAGRIRRVLEETGYQVLGGELGDWPANDEARGWAEEGRIDHRGHQLDVQLPKHLDDQLGRLAHRIQTLLDAGWSSVRVVTDHGWLLLPGGLPKIDLPKHLTESRWARCATVAGQSRVSAPTAPWHWNPEERFATAPGIACFNHSPSYAHGGLSVQECLVPDLRVEGGGERPAQATITEVSWRGMQCFVEADVTGGTASADLRLGKAAGPSIVASVKSVDEAGPTRLVVTDDEHEGSAATLVILAEDGTVLAQRDTRVGDAE
ncbi:MAG: BREX-1 system phosphatase PglZ type B [Salinibacter sp.]